MSAFLLKKMISRVFFPLPLCLILLLVGLFFLWFTHRKKTGHLFLVMGVVLLFLFSFGPTSTRLLRPLEYQYPAYHPEFLPGVDAPLDQTGPLWICIPGSSWTPHAAIPITSRMDPFFCERLLEAARINSMYTNVHLVVGMASPGTLEEKERFLDAYAALTGLSTNRVILTEVTDTESEVKEMKALVGDATAIMVSTASHIPRVMALCRQYGLHASPAPCGHRTFPSSTGERNLRADQFYPDAVSLSRSERAIYEYLGNGWVAIKAQVRRWTQ